jgi:hypothetical protein
MKCLPVALLLVAVAASGAAAQSDQQEAPPAPAAPAAADDASGEIVVEGEVPKEKRRVCETRATTGSIMPKRVCRTVAQIEQDTAAARESLDQANRDREARDQIGLLRGAGG